MVEHVSTSSVQFSPKTKHFVLSSLSSRRPTEWGVGGLSYRLWYEKFCLWQAFSRPCAVITAVGHTHRVPTLGEDGVGKHSPF